MNKLIGLTFAGICAVSANADLVSYDAQLASPNADPTTNGVSSTNLSFYDGSGNTGVQGGWTVDTNNGIELGLRAKYRQGGVIDSSTNLYTVPSGPETAATGQGLVPNRAAWNYEFAIDLRPGGVGSLTLGAITTSLTIADLTTGKSVTGDPLAYWNDNSLIGTAVSTGSTLNDKHTGQLATDYAAQNSENPSFGDFPLTAAFNGSGGAFGEQFNMDAADLYRFTLTVKQGNTQLAQDVIDVQVTPEPSTFVLLFAGAGALLYFKRRQSAAV